MLPGFLMRMIRRGGYAAHFGERFGLYPAGFPLPARNGKDAQSRNNGFVWIHAVSVGEVQVAAQIMREWRKAEPSVRFCFSTTSSTGRISAERTLTEGDRLIYNPLDFPTFVKAAFARIRPRAVVLVESELWPEFIFRAAKEKVPLFLANARVSDRSAPRYKSVRFFFKSVLRSFDRIFAQSTLDRDRLLAAGADSAKTEISGSFKFDAASRNPEKEAQLRDWIAGYGAPEGAKLIVGGSTWPGEDEILLKAYKRLLNEAKARGDVKMPVLVIAPRHFEKADPIEENILKAGFKCVRRSTAMIKGDNGETVFLADTTGELAGLYGIADFVFVGKSLCAHGSQNMIEPCICGKPTVVGPYTENFRPVMSDLLECDAIKQVRDATGLEDVFSDWLANGDGGLGARAALAVAKRRGVVAACVTKMRKTIEVKSREAKLSRIRHEGGGTIAGAFAKGLAFTAVLSIALVTALISADAFNTRKPIEEKPLPRLRAVETASVFIPLAVKPDAARVFLADLESQNFKDSFSNAGLDVDTADAKGAAPETRYDIVFATGPHTAEELRAFAGKTGERGVFVWSIDVHKMNIAEFKKATNSFPCEKWTLWMPGIRDWLFIGRPVARGSKMSAMLDLFMRPGVLTEEAEEAGCCSLPEIFASYAGTEKDVHGAFAAANANAPVEPECFIQEETPDIPWVEPDGLDSDVVETLASAIRILQSNRRSIIKAGMISKEPGRDGEAIEMWSAAMKLNPHDTMLLDRLYHLAVNAKAFAEVGNFAYAAKCYETMIAIRPDDAPVLEAFARCLDRIGRKKLAGDVRRKAKTLR